MNPEAFPRPPPAPVSLVPVTLPPTPKPTVITRARHPEMGGTQQDNDGTPFPVMVAELLQENVVQLEPLFGANGTYQVEDFIRALHFSYDWETGPSTKKTMGPIDRRRRQLVDGTPRSMDYSGERATGQGDFKIAMAHICIDLGNRLAWRIEERGLR